MTINEINEMVISAYNHIADNYLATYSANDELDVKYLAEYAHRLVGKRVLDMGCGVGVGVSYLSKCNLDVIGVDASPNMLGVAHTIFPNLKFFRQNILHTSFEDEYFDGIVLSYVINHFNQEGLVLLRNEISRLLSPNGLLFISAHIGDSEKVLPDPLDESIQIYYNFINPKLLDDLFKGYKCEFFETRKSFGEEEFLCDKMFLIYRKEQ